MCAPDRHAPPSGSCSWIQSFDNTPDHLLANAFAQTQLGFAGVKDPARRHPRRGREVLNHSPDPFRCRYGSHVATPCVEIGSSGSLIAVLHSVTVNWATSDCRRPYGEHGKGSVALAYLSSSPDSVRHRGFLTCSRDRVPSRTPTLLRTTSDVFCRWPGQRGRWSRLDIQGRR